MDGRMGGGFIAMEGGGRMKDKICTFLSKFFKNYTLKEDEDIFATGYVNSMFAMELVLFVEKEFGIKVENEDLEFENFKSINAIAQMIERKKGSMV